MRAETMACAVMAGGMTFTGCSTAYAPRPTGHVALVMDGGSVKYAKNGQTESLGFFGGGLVDAVQGNPAAEEEARSYRNLNVAGFATILGGVASVLGGSVLVVDAAGKDANAGPGFSLMIAGLVATLVGDCLIASSLPHFYDALNIYNDGVDAQRYGPPLVLPYGYPPPGFRPGAPPAPPLGAPPAPPPGAPARGTP